MKSYKTYLFWVAMIGVLLAGLILLSNNKTTQSQVANKLQVAGMQNQNYNFGQVSMAKGKVIHEYQIKNDSAQDLMIKKIYTSCMCTEASLKKGEKTFGPFGMPGHALVPSVNQTLKPGEEAIIETIFDPAAHGPAGVGKIERIVTLETSQGASELAFSAEVTP